MKRSPFYVSKRTKNDCQCADAFEAEIYEEDDSVILNVLCLC